MPPSWLRRAMVPLLALPILVSVLGDLTFAQTPEPPSSSPDAAAAAQHEPSAQALKNWRAGMAHVPRPNRGCFTSTYPNAQWQQVPCTTAPLRPYPPAHGGLPAVDAVGSGTDASAVVTGTLSEAVGSFDSVSGVTSESGEINGSPPLVANIFSLQLNSNFFTTSVCSGAANPATCKGWQQFVYSNSFGLAYMQYWLINYNVACPSGWIAFGGDCFTNSNAVSVPTQTIANLVNLSLTGQANGGGVDTITMSTGTNMYSQQNSDGALNLAAGWNVAEFNIFGDCCGSQAVFNSGASITVRTSVNNGTATAPSCSGTGFTGESNNLYFVQASTTPPSETLPALVFTESGTSSSVTPCNAATAVASNANYPLTVSETGSGTVTSSPSGINCVSNTGTCTNSFASGTSVVLTATPASGWSFTGWGGGCSGTGSCAVTMNAAQTVSATFIQIFTLTVSETGTGTVASVPAGINCGSTCSAPFDTGTLVTLTDTPAGGWLFTGWGGACSGTGSCNVTMNAAKSVSATFVQLFALSVSVSGSGSVTSSPSGINCGATCSASFVSGTQVTLTASPATGSTFNGWSGACNGTSTCLVTMNTAESVAANFASGGVQASQTWVSATSGSDSNPCTRASPCLTFAAALAQTPAGGEIDVLDPGDFGPVTITKSVTIYGDAPGVAGALPSPGTSGIVISAGSSDVINLHGLVFDGVNASGTSGVVFTSGARLNISQCVFQGFTTSGMTLSPGVGGANTTLITVQNTTIFNNATGILIRPTGGIAANVRLRRLHIDNNSGDGLRVDGTGGSGAINVAIADSSANFNAGNGIDAVSGPGNATVDVMRVVAASNGSAGIQSNQAGGGTASVTVGSSLLRRTPSASRRPAAPACSAMAITT